MRLKQVQFHKKGSINKLLPVILCSTLTPDKNMNSASFTWRSAIRNDTFRKHITLTLLLLIACAIAAPRIFQFVEIRPGVILPDPVLNMLQPSEVSVYIFALLYLLIVIAIIHLVQSPTLLLVGLQAYLLITVFRFITLLLAPLEAPPGLLLIQDPFVDKLFYQQPVTKDLFFSGHTGILALFMFLFWDKAVWRWVYATGTLVVGVLLLVQHAHYTVDVLAALPFAWLAFKLAMKMKTFRGPAS